MVRQGGVALSAESNCSSSAAGVWLPKPPGTYRRRPPWWPYAASLPGPRLQWRDRTGFSPVSLSAPPDLLGEPNCRGTILAVKTLSPAGALHHRGLSCVFTILRPRRCRALRWLGAPRAGSAPSSPALRAVGVKAAYARFFVTTSSRGAWGRAAPSACRPQCGQIACRRHNLGLPGHRGKCGAR